MSAGRDRLAVTLVNRNPADAESVAVVLRDLAFDGEARIGCVTAERDPAARVLPDVEGTFLERGSQPVKGAALSLTLPPQSFTVVEAPLLA